MPLECVTWDHLEKINETIIFLIMHEVHKENTCQNCINIIVPYLYINAYVYKSVFSLSCANLFYLAYF